MPVVQAKPPEDIDDAVLHQGAQDAQHPLDAVQGPKRLAAGEAAPFDIIDERIDRPLRLF